MKSVPSQFDFRRSDPESVLGQLRAEGLSGYLEPEAAKTKSKSHLPAAQADSMSPTVDLKIFGHEPGNLESKALVAGDTLDDGAEKKSKLETAAETETQPLSQPQPQSAEQPTVQANWQQLVADVKQSQLELEQRKSDFEVQVWDWQQSASRQQAAIDRRREELDHRERQLSLLRLELAELQNALIDQAINARTNF